LKAANLQLLELEFRGFDLGGADISECLGLRESPERPPHAKYERLMARAKQVRSPKTIVVHPCDESSLRGALEAADAGLIDPVLVGPEEKIRTVAQRFHFDISPFEIGVELRRNIIGLQSTSNRGETSPA
jgi:hypothetical protein